jgi:hypothetical protein
MGSHSMQAVALTAFLLGSTVLCAGLALGVNVLLVIVGLAAIAVSIWLFTRCKALDETTES